jgi:hypothetical protein
MQPAERSREWRIVLDDALDVARWREIERLHTSGSEER